MTLRKSCLAAVCPRSKVLSGPWAPVTASLADDAADTPLCMQLAPWRPGAASLRTSPVPEKFCAHWALRPQIPFSSPGLLTWWVYSPGAPASWDIVKVPQDTTQGPGRASRRGAFGSRTYPGFVCRGRQLCLCDSLSVPLTEGRV